MILTEKKLRSIIKSVINEMGMHAMRQHTSQFGPLTATLDKNNEYQLTLALGNDVVMSCTPEEYTTSFCDLPEGFETEAEEAIDWARDWYEDSMIDADYSDLDDPSLNPYR